MEKKLVLRYLVLGLIFVGLVSSLLLLRSNLVGFAVFEQAEEANFTGTYENTFYNSSGFIQLNATYTSGNYTSQIFDAGSGASWNNISWTEGLPYWKELPNDTNTLMLCHFNDTTDCSIGNMAGKSESGVTYDTGKFNTNGSYISDTGYIIYNATDNINTSKGTVEFWFRAASDFWEDGADNILFFAKIDNNNNIRIINRNKDNLRFSYKAEGIASRVTIEDSDAWITEWHYFAMTWDTAADEFRAYVDGIQVGITQTGLGIWEGTLIDFNIGSNANEAKQAPGVYEEFKISNIARASDEILDNYKRGALRLNLIVRSCDDNNCSGESWQDIDDTSLQDLSGIIADNRYFQYKFQFETDDSSFSPELYNTTIDYTILNSAPTITLVNPQNGATYGTNESLALDFIANDADNNIDSCWYNVNNGNNVSISNCENTTFDVVGDGSYTLNIHANDTSGEEASDSASFDVQVGAPTLILNSPIDSYLNSQNVTFSYTPTDIDLDSCELWFGDGTFALNQTDTSPISDSENTFSLTLQDGQYLWNIRCNDTQANSAFNGNKTFYIDTIFPSLSLSEPQGGKSSRTVIAEWIVSDTSPISCLYNVYRGASVEVANTSVDCDNNNASFDVTVDANFVFNFYVNDSAGNKNSNSSNFIVSTSTPSPPAPGGGGGGGGGVFINRTVVSKLEISKISNLIVNPGESKKLVLGVKNTGNKFLNDCRIRGKGKNAGWLSSEEVKGLSVGEKYDFILTLNVPEILGAGSYAIEMDLICLEHSESVSFVAEIIEKKLAIDLIDIERTSRDKIKVFYSLTELSGVDQEVEVEIVLFDYNNERLAEIIDIRYIKAASKQDFEAVLEIPSDLQGSFNLLINTISETSSNFLQEEVILGSAIGGLAILGGEKGDTFVSILLLGLFAIFAIFVIRRILKLKKKGRSKEKVAEK